MDKVLNIILYIVCLLQTSATCCSHVTAIREKQCHVGSLKYVGEVYNKQITNRIDGILW